MGCYNVDKLLKLIEPYAPDMFLMYKREIFSLLSEYALKLNPPSTDVFSDHAEDDEGSSSESETESERARYATPEPGYSDSDDSDEDTDASIQIYPASYLVQAKNFSYAEAFFVVAVSGLYDEWKNAGIYTNKPIDKQFMSLVESLEEAVRHISSNIYYAHTDRLVLNAVKHIGSNDKLFKLESMESIQEWFEENTGSKHTYTSGDRYARFLTFPELRKGQKLARPYGNTPKQHAVLEAIEEDIPKTKLPKNIVSDVKSVVLVYT